jgi:sugar phosphate isomerase/epimerase
MNRRKFTRGMLLAASAAWSVRTSSVAAVFQNRSIRLGGPVFMRFSDPGSWVEALKQLGYRAAYCPLEPGADPALIRATELAAAEAGITVAEVGAWSNPISPDDLQRREATEKCIRALELADAIGARCCVNISGSRNAEQWAGPHPDNLTDETFDLVVESTRKIIDAVRPKRTFFALEPMPWAFPDSPDTYLRLIQAIDRRQFGVHFDPVNMIWSPRLYFGNGAFIRECFKKLGPYLRSCHAKDIIMPDNIYTPHFDEVRPGLGRLDYAAFLDELSRYPDVPLMMEHLQTAEEYNLAAAHIREVGAGLGIRL